MAERLLIVGASARAAAESAKRASFEPLAIDQFGDQDLRDIAEVRLCHQFPEQIPELAETLPTGGLVLTGAMENHLSVVEAISPARPYWGCPLHAIAAVRDPVRLQETLRQNNLPSVKTRLAGDVVAADGIWLKKPLRSACGIGVSMLNAEQLRQAGCESCESEDHYYQERIEGVSQSGVFVASARSTVLMGVTDQWIGVPWLNARPFGYAGSLGPIRLRDTARRTWQQIGEVIRQGFGLRGIFGVDAVVQHGSIHVIEVNPRFPASAEIIDFAGDGQLIRHHVRACTSDEISVASDLSPEWMFAKAIYYAPQDLIVPPDLESIVHTISSDRGILRMADIPSPGTKIKQGNPVITLISRDTSATNIHRTLRESINCLMQFLTCRGNQGIDSHTT